MHTEIERKFIVTDSTFKQSAVRIMDIRQGYVGTSSNGEARVSIRDEKAWVIIKSNGCLARLEYEIPIPKKDAEELLSFTCDRVIHKTRYIIPCEDSMLKWEVDEFHGEDEGLIIAEIELPRKDMPFEKPQWLGKEVTQDTTYYNSTLSKTSWKAIQKSRADRIIEIQEFLGGDTIVISYEDADNPYMYIETLEGTMKASVGDYIIKGVNGEFYPCKPDIFEKTYEEVAE